MDPAISTSDALRLVDVVATSGARTLAFVGGDPSLRGDLGVLTARARARGLRVEIQTNAQVLRTDALEAILSADTVGVSIDGSSSSSHDGFRAKQGNFSKVLGLLDMLEVREIPTFVRTVVAKPNADELGGIGALLSGYSCVRRWSLLEFSPVGSGLMTRGVYELDSERFEKVVIAGVEAYRGSGKVDIYRLSDKMGTYALVTASGRLYGTGGGVDGSGRYPTVGNLLSDHLDALVADLPFAAELHESRYGSETER